MGFQVSTITAIPLDPDTSFDSPTWGEAGGPYSVPPKESVGYGAEALSSNDVNYTRQHWARWTRALRDRMVLADEGLLTTCVVKQGAWNLNGGTLDITLAPTRLVVDVDGDGGTVLEIKAPAISPETLTASSDSYVDLDEAGDVVVVAVANGAPEPAVTAGHVRVWKLVTDATELTSVELAGDVPAYPRLGPAIAIDELHAGAATLGTTVINGDLSVIGSLSDLIVAGTSTLQNDVMCQAELIVDGPATFNDEVTLDSIVTANSSITAKSDVTIGSAPTDTLAVNATTTHTAPATFGGLVTMSAGASLSAGQAITGTATSSVIAGIIDTISADGAAKVGELQFYSDGTPSGETGVMQFGGRFLSIGLNSLARKISVPYDSYVAGPVATVNAIQDTGAEIVNYVMITGDVVIVEMDYEAKNSIGSPVNVRIEVNGVAVGSTEPQNPVSNNVYFTVRRVIRYVAPATALYTFKARFGAAAGTSTVQNILLTMRHA